MKKLPKKFGIETSFEKFSKAWMSSREGQNKKATANETDEETKSSSGAHPPIGTLVLL